MAVVDYTDNNKRLNDGTGQLPALRLVQLGAGDYAQWPCIQPGATTVVAIGASSAASAAIAAGVVRLVATADCFIVFGAATPTATTSGMFLPANVPEYFQFTTGQEVAVIQSVIGGNLYITAAA